MMIHTLRKMRVFLAFWCASVKLEGSGLGSFIGQVGWIIWQFSELLTGKGLREETSVFII